MTDNRTQERFEIKRGVQIKLSSGTVVHGITRDLSFSGSFIECDTTDLHFIAECHLLVSLGTDEESAEIFSDIRYYDEDGIGCHFLTFDSGYYQFLTNYSLLAKNRDIV